MLCLFFWVISFTSCTALFICTAPEAISFILSVIKNINEVTVEVKAGSAEMLKGGEGVAEEMNKLDNLTRTITDSMNEMASGAVQINNAVQEVNEITQKNKQSIESLAREVGKFKV